MKLPSHRRLTQITIVMLVAVLPVLWLNRWHVSRTAVEIANPLVRSWVTGQVLSQSDSAYHLTVSTIRVDIAHRRLAIDTITLTTDTAVNARLRRPHPILAMRFSRCAVTGIDLAGFASGRGLHAALAGCDSVAVAERTVTLPIAAAPQAEGPDSNNFLRFQGKIDLPGALPFVAIDAISLPHVQMSLDLQAADGHRTALVVDSLAVRLDSVRIDPREPVAERHPLFARDINVKLDGFDGSTHTAAHFSLQHLDIHLENGSCRLDALVYEPAPGRRADSLGFAALRAQHITLTGVRWNVFLLTGDVKVGEVGIDSAVVRITPPPLLKRYETPQYPAKRLELSLRALGRAVRVDSLTVTALRVVEEAPRGGDSAVTTVRRITAGRLAFSADDADWGTPLPLGPLTVAVDGLFRRTPKRNFVIPHLVLDAAERRITADTIRASPAGDDSAFAHRHPYQKVRLSVIMGQVQARGIDLPALLRRGAWRTRALSVGRLVVDVMEDKTLPSNPGPKSLRRFPQQVIRDMATEIQVDTALASGLVTYRERDHDATNAGTLTFGAIRLRGYNFSTVPSRMTAATPFRLIGDASLMGAGAMHVEWDVPLLSRTFAMTWHGSLGSMDPKAMNAFLVDAVGMRFTGGTFDGATWNVNVVDGIATGKLSPRWHDFHVGLPGVARHDSSVVGGLLRGVAKLAANTFGIHGDNDSLGGHHPLDASITHQWVREETLPQFIWFQLREPLLLILKK